MSWTSLLLAAALSLGCGGAAPHGPGPTSAAHASKADAAARTSAPPADSPKARAQGARPSTPAARESPARAAKVRVKIDLGPTGGELAKLRAQSKDGLADITGFGRPLDRTRGTKLLRASCLNNEFMSCIHLKKHAPVAAKALLRRVRGLCMVGFSRGCDSGYYLADIWEGIALAERGCQLGHQGSCGSIAALSAGGVKSSLGTAEGLYTQACKHGHSLSCVQFAHMIENKEPAKAARLLARACKLGDAFYCKRVVPAGCIAAKLTPGNSKVGLGPASPGKQLRLHRVDFGLRLAAGKRCIPPSTNVRAAMRGSGKKHFSLDLDVCVGTKGRVTKTDVTRPSGHPAWDNAVIAATATWRFRPYQTKRGPISICSSVVLYHEEK